MTNQASVIKVLEEANGTILDALKVYDRLSAGFPWLEPFASKAEEALKDIDYVLFKLRDLPADARSGPPAASA